MVLTGWLKQAAQGKGAAFAAYGDEQQKSRLPLCNLCYGPSIFVEKHVTKLEHRGQVKVYILMWNLGLIG
jgi:hypothetical protein